MNLGHSASQPGELDLPCLRVAENETLRKKTFEVLQEAIWSGRLKPGSRLVERNLCQMTGVSRSSIREALRYLESESLVESRGVKGVFVRVLTPDAVAEIREVQRVLGSEAASRFCERATDAEVDAIASAYAAIKTVQAGDAQAFVRHIDRFIDALFRGARNSVAERLMTSLRNRMRLVNNATTAPAAGPTRGSIEQLGAVVRALSSRNSEAAATEWRRYGAGSETVASF